jgi:hypothetical protein
MARAVLSVFVAVLLVLSGCSTFIDGGDSTPTVQVTPAPVPTDKPTPTPIPRIAPGVTTHGLINASALIDAHTAFLANTSYTVHSRRILKYPNGTVAARSVGTMRVEGNAIYSTGLSTRFSGERHTETWYSDGQILMKVTTNNSTSYNLITPPESFRRVFLPVPKLIMRSELRETTITERTAQNGTTLYHLKITTQNGATIRALIGPRGLIHNYTVRKPISRSISTIPNATHSIKTVQLTNIGTTTVERPSWYSRAINKTTTSEQNDHNNHRKHYN